MNLAPFLALTATMSGGLTSMPRGPRPRVRGPDLGERQLADEKRRRRALRHTRELTERIELAAIQLDGVVYSVPRPGRHHDVCRVMGARWRDREALAEQGFTTSTGRFVGRKEALAIATAAGQIVHRCGGDHVALYTENLW